VTSEQHRQTDIDQNILDAIDKIINEHLFITEVELVLSLTSMSQREPTLSDVSNLLDILDILEILNWMVANEQIRALDYTPETMPYRSKTIYFSSGTILEIRKGGVDGSR